MTRGIANPLIQLSAQVISRAKPYTKALPDRQKMDDACEKTTDSRTAQTWIATHLSTQARYAMQGDGEQYRPEEREARNVPLSTEVPGFIRDFQGMLAREFYPHLPDRVKHGHDNNNCAELAERLYAIAARVKSFRGAGTHEFITCLELADRFDPSIRFRLATQLAENERAKNPALSSEEESAMKRQVIGVIDGITRGILMVHEGPEEEELDLGQFQRLAEDRGNSGNAPSL